MKIAVVALGILAALSSLPLASTGYALAAAHGGGIVFYLLPAASFVAAGLALDLTALSGFLLLAVALSWFKLGPEVHYPASVFMTATLAFNAAGGLLGVAAWALGIFGKAASERNLASPTIDNKAIDNKAAASFGVPRPSYRNGDAHPAATNASSHPRHADRQHAVADPAQRTDVPTDLASDLAAAAN